MNTNLESKKATVFVPSEEDFLKSVEMFPVTKGPESVLKKRNRILVVGSTVVDLSFYVKQLPVAGQTLPGRFQQGLGGKGFNQAVAAARSGEEVRFISAMGSLRKDPYSTGFIEKLSHYGIDQRVVLSEKTATGAASIAVSSSGENQIIVSLGANEELTPEFLQENEDFFEGVEVLVAQFEIPLPTILKAAVLLKEKNPHAKFILNPAPAFDDVPGKILRLVDFITPNETELQALSGKKVVDVATAREACLSLVKQWGPDCPRNFIVTLGSQGVLHFNSLTGLGQQFSAIDVDAVDTAGAGDAFSGSFAAALAKAPTNLAGAIEYAVTYAGLSVTKEGTSSSMPTYEEVQEWWRETNEINVPPRRWWSAVGGKAFSLAPAWERLPQAALFGEVVVSKRSDLGLLSNFSETPFELDGQRYPSVEGFWQMMFFPDPDWSGGSDQDPRLDPNLKWGVNDQGELLNLRSVVSQMHGHEAFAAGVVGFANMRRLGLNWISYLGKVMPYWVFEKGDHYRLIVRALKAKLEQNPEVKAVLMRTKGFQLIPDHFEPALVPPSWKYTDIWMEIRDGSL